MPADIVFVIGSLTIGGTEKQLVMLAKGLKARGWSVAVFAFDGSGVMADRLAQEGIRLVDGGYRSSLSRFHKTVMLLFCLLKLTGLLRREHPRIVQGFLPGVTFVSALSARLARTPVNIISKRALATHQDRSSILKWLDRAANRMADVITANAATVAEDTAARDGYPQARIVVIPNGMEFAEIDRAASLRQVTRGKLGLKEDEIAIIMVANLLPYKRHAVLIRAFAKLAPHHSGKLFLAGRDDGAGASLVELAAKLGVANRTFVLGQCDWIPSLLSAMDVGVMASPQEGMSNAVMEKLASGLPMVAAGAGGNLDVLKGMPGCVLVRPDDPEDMSRGIEEVIAALSTGNKNGELRRVARLRFSVDGMVESHELLYRGAIAARSAGG
jgi:glycosyltransferase involved in cell wall biosynthesis